MARQLILPHILFEIRSRLKNSDLVILVNPFFLLNHQEWLKFLTMLVSTIKKEATAEGLQLPDGLSCFPPFFSVSNYNPLNVIIKKLNLITNYITNYTKTISIHDSTYIKDYFKITLPTCRIELQTSALQVLRSAN